MQKKRIIALADMSDKDISLCKIIEKREGYIRFVVDEGLSRPEKHLELQEADNIVQTILHKKQINKSITNLVTNGLGNGKMSYIGQDVMYQTFLTCFAQHRPLVLSPDMIWLLIMQTIAKRIDSDPELYRTEFVDFKDKKNLSIESKTDIFDKETDWKHLLQDMYEKIAANARGGIAQSLYCDFSTTGANERIASIATLMGTLKTYFQYHIIHYICGIPYIELWGSVDDWENVLQKSTIIKKLGMKTWYEWLHPILKEFVRAAKGKPNFDFWKNIVMTKRDDDFSIPRGCQLNDSQIDGWCIALFPYKEDQKMTLGKRFIRMTMDNEITRTPFVYQRILSNGQKENFPMELWSGFVGVEEDNGTFALKPKIGWFVRQSDIETETITRLKEQDSHRGIRLTDIEVVPEILKKLQHINSLTLNFKDKINLPEWLKDIEIDNLTVFGEIGRKECRRLRSIYKNISINRD